MRILQINAVYGVGSTGVIVQDLHELSLKNGIESYVAFSKSKMQLSEIKNGYKVGSVFGKKLHALFGRINGKQAYFSRFATRKLLKHIRRIKPDIVHLHNLHSNYIHLNMLLKFLAAENIKTVITLHDCWFYTGGCFYYTVVQCNRWMSGCYDCPKKLQDTRAYFFDRCAQIWSNRRRYLGAINSLQIVGVSHWITSEFQKSNIGANRFFTIYNGIDTDYFCPTISSLRQELGLENKFVILGMANKWLLKANEETLHAVCDGLEQDSVLLLVGCTSQEKLPSNVIPFEYIHDRDLLRKIYSMADVFVNCTREDSLPTVNLEAQACGTPIITYENTGTMETVDGISGFAVANNDSCALLKKINEVKRNGKLQYSHACREYVVRTFRKEINYQAYFALYKSL